MSLELCETVPEGRVVPVLEHDHLVGGDVAHVDLLPGLDGGGVERLQEPRAVGKQEAALGVVRVRVRLAVLVVEAVELDEAVDGEVVEGGGDAVGEEEEELEGRGGLVGAVGPEAVSAGGGAQAERLQGDEEEDGP